MKINSLFEEINTWISNSYLIRQSFQSYRFESGILQSVLGGSLEITLTVPIKLIGKQNRNFKNQISISE